MRSTLALLVLVAALPLSAQQSDPLAFLRHGNEPADIAFATYRDQPYAPVRSGEVRAAGFLTESRAMPFGQLLGPVDPPVVRATQSAEAAMPGMVVIEKSTPSLNAPTWLGWTRIVIPGSRS